MKRKQGGFSIVEVIIVGVIVILLALVGYFTIQRLSGNDETTEDTAITQTTVPSAPTINTVDDLDRAAQTLDDVKIDDNTAQLSNLETELNKF